MYASNVGRFPPDRLIPTLLSLLTLPVAALITTRKRRMKAQPCDAWVALQAEAAGSSGRLEESTGRKIYWVLSRGSLTVREASRLKREIMRETSGELLFSDPQYT